MSLRSLKSLSMKIVIAVTSVLIVGLALTNILQMRYTGRIFIDSLKKSTSTVNTSLRAALHNSMLKNDSEGLDLTIEKVGAMEGMNEVFLVDAEGKVTRSSVKSAVARQIDADLLARLRKSGGTVEELVEPSEGKAFVRTIARIQADKKCMDCHSQKEGEAVGYLGVDISADQDLNQLKSARNYGFLCNVLVLLLLMIVVVVASRTIFKPLGGLTEAARRIAVGDFGHALDHKSEDEIGKLAESFREMKSYIQGVAKAAEALGNGDLSVQVIPKSDRDLLSQNIAHVIEIQRNLSSEALRLSKTAVEGELATRGDASQFKGVYREIIQGVNNTLDAVIGPINEAAQVLQRVAQRDLAARVQGNSRGDLAKIKDALNLAIQNLDDALANVALSAEQVSSASVQINSGSQSLAQGASEQASALEEVTCALQEMSTMTKQNASNAKEGRNLAEGARASADRGVDNMKRLSEAIHRIKESSDSTAKIVKTIDEIAFQTNLLALNAAVEAARAGDAGKGFAVVAEEVRNLAMRSAEAAKNTANLIEESVKNAEGGVAINQEVLKNLLEINSQVNKVSNVMAEISTASDQQSQRVEQVNSAVEQMNQTTQQTAANAEESASAAEELASQSEEMKSMVGSFVLTQTGVSANPSPHRQRTASRPTEPALLTEAAKWATSGQRESFGIKAMGF